MAIDPETSLRELPPKKARWLLDMLPIIEAKIKQGVSHGQIIRALDTQGLKLSKSTYFSYLRRFRGRGAAAGRGAHAPITAPKASPVPSGELPAKPSQGSENAARRPPTFDYDPRGIPDLLK